MSAHANLKPFPKGVSDNPGGRPRGALSLPAEIRRQLGEVDSNDELGRTHLQIVVAKAIERAKGGDTQANAALKELADRLHGRPRQNITVDSDRLGQLERKLQNFISESRAEGDELTRDEAISILAEEDADFELLLSE